MQNRYEPPEIRFWMRVKSSRDGCWIWTGAKERDGYGKMKADGREVTLHRFSWRIHFGEITPGMFVCHRCDNPACVRPNHLFLGTAAENNADRHKKGRSRFGNCSGEKNGRSVLTDSIVREIRRLAAAGIRQNDIAERFSISPPQIHYVVNRKTWKHIT